MRPSQHAVDTYQGFAQRMSFTQLSGYYNLLETGTNTNSYAVNVSGYLIWSGKSKQSYIGLVSRCSQLRVSSSPLRSGFVFSSTSA